MTDFSDRKLISVLERIARALERIARASERIEGHHRGETDGDNEYEDEED